MNILEIFKSILYSIKVAAPTLRLFPQLPEIQLPEKKEIPEFHIPTDEERMRAAWQMVGDCLREAMEKVKADNPDQ